MLFEDSSEGNVQTLMNPVNLHNFFEHYKNGDFDAVRKHFSYDYVNHPITNEEIKGLMAYFQYLIKEFYQNTEKGIQE